MTNQERTERLRKALENSMIDNAKSREWYIQLEYSTWDDELLFDCINELTQEISRLQEQIVDAEEMEDAVVKLENTISDLETDISEMSDTIDDLNSDLDERGERIKELEGTIQSLNYEISELQESVGI